ncbi:hypothetical protein AWB68_07979 [Caballeronia choica]|uniref:Methyltransferase type 11 domain-containing protein n=1 Tax=Caballeronia choica TaxID=326476 RepID=A0A158KYT6_9BURK|nr:methyltransferase domain-containing protein [Caballeronia choica]SAL86292.1 hypothetical protein AWB68_07979 [Caballeronia choica]
MIAFTICSKNFLGYALSLRATLQAHHGPITFYVAICDDIEGFDINAFDFEIISIDELGIPRFDEMRNRYNITELNTSIKPFVFSYLFDRHPGEHIIYLDPDILVVGPFTELLTCFESGADCVLTPHILEPAEFAEMEDRQFLNFGIYNLGFCAFRDTPQVRRVVAWWGRRLETQCVIDLQNGLFVDQKWADLMPAFINKTVILHHAGYNVAYWNLSQRLVRRENGHWLVNAQPLRFVHFSGNKIEDPTIFSRHSAQFRANNIGDLRLLLDSYRRSVHRHGHWYYSTLTYGFNWHGESGHNLHTPIGISAEREKATWVRPYFPMLASESLADFRHARTQMESILSRRRRTEVDAIPFDLDAYQLPGFCACCGKDSRFQVSGMYSSSTLEDGRVFPNWREHLNCLSCGLVNRVRACIHLFYQEISPSSDARIYITEQKTTTYDWLKERFPNVQGSEYWGDGCEPGEVISGIRNEDIQRLSFAADTFDHIMTFDVLEHVPNHKSALQELFRCLAPNGSLMMTVPFRPNSYEYEIRAELQSNGEIRHIMEPEYHGNPVDMEHGSICFRYFGWQLLDELREIGFCKARIVTYWSESLRYMGDPQLIITAEKPPALSVASDSIV